MSHFKRPLAAVPAQTSRSARPPWVYATLCAVVVAIYFLSFPSHRYGYDAIEYSYGVKIGHSLFHPHHLLYNAFGRLLLVAVSSLALVDTISLLTAANGVITATSVGLLCLLLHRTLDRPPLAILLSLLFACCRGITNMATSVEVYPATTLFELGALCLFVFRPRTSIPTLIGIGVFSALAALFHQTGIFFVFAMAYGLWQRDRVVRHASVFLLTALGICGGAYLWVGMIVEKRPLSGLWPWITAYAHSEEFQLGMWGHGLRWKSIPSALVGLFQTVTAPYYLEHIDWQFRPTVIEAGLSLALIAALLLALRLSVLALRSKRDSRVLAMRAGQGSHAALDNLRLRGLLRVWLIFHSAFTLWWEPENFEFWLMILPPLLLWLGDLWRHLDRSAHSLSLQLGATLALLAVGNFGLCTLPNHRGLDNPNAEVYQVIARHGVDVEDVYVGDFATLQLYFQYYQGKHVPLRSLRFVGYSHLAQKQSVLAAYRSQLEELRRTHRVYFLEHELSDQYDFWNATDVRTVYEPMLPQATVVGSYLKGSQRYRILQLAPMR